jgi:hypothetical protein
MGLANDDGSFFKTFVHYSVTRKSSPPYDVFGFGEQRFASRLHSDVLVVVGACGDREVRSSVFATSGKTTEMISLSFNH